MSWLKQFNTCPACRFKLPTKEEEGNKEVAQTVVDESDRLITGNAGENGEGQDEAEDVQDDEDDDEDVVW